MSRMRILIADDHAVVREGLVRVVADQHDMHVVAEAGNGDEAVAAARATDPHVALLSSLRLGSRDQWRKATTG